MESKATVARINGKIAGWFVQRAFKKASLMECEFEHRQLCAQREERTKKFQLGQMFARKIEDDEDKGKNKIRDFFERIFRVKEEKEEQQKRLNSDVNRMFGNVN